MLTRVIQVISNLVVSCINSGHSACVLLNFPFGNVNKLYSRIHIDDMECRDIKLVVAISRLDISCQIQNILIKFYGAVFSG